MQNNFLSPLLAVLVIALVLLSIVAIFYLYLTAKNRERLALIEKGMNPNLANSDFWPRVGIIGGGISTGLIVGDIAFKGAGGGYGPLMGIAFAGVGLIVFNLLRKSKMQRDNNR